MHRPNGKVENFPPDFPRQRQSSCRTWHLGRKGIVENSIPFQGPHERARSCQVPCTQRHTRKNAGGLSRIFHDRRERFSTIFRHRDVSGFPLKGTNRTEPGGGNRHESRPLSRHASSRGQNVKRKKKKIDQQVSLQGWFIFRSGVPKGLAMVDVYDVVRDLPVSFFKENSDRFDSMYCIFALRKSDRNDSIS